MAGLQYFFWATYRRKILDDLLESNRHYYKGIVLDIGGRDRGRFEKPREDVERWIFADVESRFNPDIILKVEDMKEIDTENIDVVNAVELFEHVWDLSKGLQECFRVLKKDGVMIISTPFLFPIHADPYDYQRWTRDKWRKELERVGFTIEKLEEMGYFFTVMADMFIALIKQFPVGIRHLFKLLYPLLSLFVKLDDFSLIRNNSKLNKYTTGYFMVVRKQDH